MGAALGLLSAIFGTQWAEYQKRQDATSVQPGTPTWLRRLLFSGLLLLMITGTNAQTTWTRRYQTPSYILFDVAYGAGRYVTVGNNGLIQISGDGVTWTTQVAASQSAGALIRVVYANGQFVAVGSSGHVSTSPDGLTWSSQVSGTTKSLSGLAYGGGRFIAVGDNGVAITSTDGITWTPLTTGTSVELNDITYGSGTFTIVGDGGLIRTTPNGIIWTARASGTVVSLKGVTAGANGQVVAVGDNNTVIRSPDGIVWTAQVVAGTPLPLSAVSYDPVQSLYVAVTESSFGSHQLFRSPDGINWSPWSSGTSSDLYGVRYVNGRFIAVGLLGLVLSSLNGINWHPLTIGYYTQFNAAAYGNGHYVAVGKYPINLQPAIGSVAATSTDGINYTLGTTEHVAGAGEGFNDVVWGNGQFVAVGGEAIIQTSVDGKAWTLRYSTMGASLYGVACGAGQYVAVGAGFGGNVVRSTNGTTWTKGTTGPNTFYYGITHANGQFVAVGFNGAIATSPEGIDWTAHSSGTGNLLTSVAYGNGTYVAVGVGGTVVKSVNSIIWSVVPSFTGSDINRVTFGNGQFVTVGEDGELFTSPDGTVWTARLSKSDGNTLNGVMHGNGLFVAVGADATFVTSPDDVVVPPVNQVPAITVNPTTLSGFTTDHDTPSSAQQFTLDASGFPPSAAFTAYAPAGYELSFDGILYGTNLSIAVNNSGTRNVNIYVRLRALQALGAHTGDITFDSKLPNQPILTTVSLSGTVSVNPVAPVAPALPNQTATVGSFFSFVVPAFTGTAPITYQASGLPAGLSFDAATRTINGTPTTVQAPTVTITAVNAAGQSTGQFSITVSAPPPVNPGAFAITGVTLVSCQAVSATQRQLVFTPQYTGTNGQPISFEVVNEMVPTTNAGPYTLGMYIDNPTITLKATQSGTPGQTSFAYNWLAACTGGVPSSNQPPVAPVIANASATVGQVYSQTILPFTDPEGQPLTYTVIGLPPGLLVTGGGNISGPPSTAGVYIITVTATDPGGLSASATYTLTINPAGSNPNAFAITGVTLVSCQAVSATQRQLVFTPQYGGSNGQPISFEVVNEMVPTTNAGPYTLGMYIDNPTITLKATQSGTPGEASFAYTWLTACQNQGARIGVSPLGERQTALEVRVLGNPVENGAALVEVRGAGGQPIQMELTDLRGRVIGSHQVGQAESVEQHSFEIGHQSAGLYLLRVNTPTQMQTVKVLKR
ncbi:hypothetical protein GCM10027423_61360 [Spirosoma arcticum]